MAPSLPMSYSVFTTLSKMWVAKFMLLATSLCLIIVLASIIGCFLIDRKGLRKYPAPSIAAFTPLWGVYQTLRNVRYQKVMAAHKQLGPVVRLGPNHLSFVIPEAMRDIYAHGSPLLKDQFYANFAGDNPSIADATDRMIHSQRRRLMAHFFSPKEVLKVEPKIWRITAQLCRALVLKSEGKPVSDHDHYQVVQGIFNVRPWFDMFSYDAVTAIIWSMPYALLDQGNDLCKARIKKGLDIDVPAMSTFHDGIGYLIALAQLPNFWYKVGLKVWQHTYAAKCAAKFSGMVKYLVEERMASTPLEPDLFSSIPTVPSEKRPEPMTVKQVTAECSILLNAGHDTTQTSLSSFTYLLTTHPRVQEKLYKELRERLPGSNIVYSYNDIQAVPYLRACIDETLRVLPPTRYGLPRRTPASGAIIAGHNIAPDVTVSVPLDVLHLNEDLFISATEFIPERWIATEAALEGLAANPDTQRLLADIPIEQRKVFAAQSQNLREFVQPFQMGSRACIGRNIAFMELSVALTALVLGFEWELAAEKHPNGMEYIERLTCNPKALFVKVRPREGVVINETV